MTVLDAYAVIAYLRGEPAAPQVAEILRGEQYAVTALGLAEVVDRMVRLAGIDERELVLDLADLGLLDTVAVDGQLGLAAGRFRARHYHRVRRAVSMADCVAAAAAQSLAQTLATADPDLLELCHVEKIAIRPLPGSDGSSWQPQPA